MDGEDYPGSELLRFMEERVWPLLQDFKPIEADEHNAILGYGAAGVAD